MNARIGFRNLFVRVYALMVGLSFGLGAVVLSGGPARFSAPSFETARSLVEPLPYAAPHVYWGGLFLLHGIALVSTLGRTSAVHVLRFGVVAFWFLGITFLASVMNQPTAALTAIIAYGVFGALYLILSDHLSSQGWGA